MTGGRDPLTPEQVATIREMLLAGNTIREAKERAGVGFGTVLRLRAKLVASGELASRADMMARGEWFTLQTPKPPPPTSGAQTVAEFLARGGRITICPPAVSVAPVAGLDIPPEVRAAHARRAMEAPSGSWMAKHRPVRRRA